MTRFLILHIISRSTTTIDIRNYRLTTTTAVQRPFALTLFLLRTSHLGASFTICYWYSRQPLPRRKIICVIISLFLLPWHFVLASDHVMVQATTISHGAQEIIFLIFCESQSLCCAWDPYAQCSTYVRIFLPHALNNIYTIHIYFVIYIFRFGINLLGMCVYTNN